MKASTAKRPVVAARVTAQVEELEAVTIEPEELVTLEPPMRAELPRLELKKRKEQVPVKGTLERLGELEAGLKGLDPPPPAPKPVRSVQPVVYSMPSQQFE
jgi:hypothetical protein